MLRLALAALAFAAPVPALAASHEGHQDHETDCCKDKDGNGKMDCCEDKDGDGKMDCSMMKPDKKADHEGHEMKH